MSKLKLNITMSIDGFVAGPNQSPEHPLGVGGEQLHDWLAPARPIMGRNMFGGGPGPWDESWKGWWGEQSALQQSRRPH